MSAFKKKNSLSKTKKNKKNNAIYVREMNLIQINMNYCLFQFDP